jgi:DNA-3-methyladenine glycosylase II
MALKRPDIWPTGDVALATAVGKLRSLPQRPSFRQLAEMAEAWRPFRSVAARMLWQYYLARRDQGEK